jgi:hypothetical protein
MFVLTKEELTKWRSQLVTSKSDRMGMRHPPMAFTYSCRTSCQMTGLSDGI